MESDQDKKIKRLEKRARLLAEQLKTAEASRDQWRDAYQEQFRAQREASEREGYFRSLLSAILVEHREKHALEFEVTREAADALAGVIAGRCPSVEELRDVLELARRRTHAD